MMPGNALRTNMASNALPNTSANTMHPIAMALRDHIPPAAVTV
jgi:hypothetical protein